MKVFYLFKMITLVIFLLGVMSPHTYANKRYDHSYDRYNVKQKSTKGYRYDERYRHGRYYPSTGFRIKSLPRHHHSVLFRNRPYFYSQGIWYVHNGVQFVVTVPPLGIIAPFLPPFYTTLWVDGVPYYYANDIYYTWHSDKHGYVVTSPPQDIKEEETYPLNEELFVYPKEGQSEKKQADDRYECHRWSVSQSKYDPTKPAENLTQPELGIKYENYQKALKACLEGRGYSVR